MDLNLNIRSEDIERQIVDAVIASSVGTKIKAAVTNSLSTYTIDAAVKEVVLAELKRMAIEEVTSNPEYRQKIHEAILTRVTEEHINGLIERLMDRMD